MRAIETPQARTALWMLAENLPVMLMDMYKENPQELLQMIEKKVQNAMDWKQQAIKNGMNKDQAEELSTTILQPSYMPENPEPMEITEQQMEEIIQTLMKLQ